MALSINPKTIEEMEPWFVDHLSDAIQIPSVSSDQSFAGHVRQCADYFNGLFIEIGAESEIVQTDNYPVVLGTMNIGGSDAPTVMVYSHIDVQPSGNPLGWAREPFSGEIDIDKKIVYGRGATDDKGPTLIGIAAAKKAKDLGIPVNLRLVLDTEEESGSPSFPQVIKSRPDFFNGVDYLLLNDGMWASDNRPSLMMGRRGLVATKLDLELAKGSVHSGLAGGVALNPLAELTALYHSCVDWKTGELLIPEIYDGMSDVPEAELDECLKSFDPEAFLHYLGLDSRAIRPMTKKDMLKNLGGMPTLEMHGLAGGHTSWNGFSTSIPGSARMYLSMRVAHGQNPHKMYDALKKHVEKFDPKIEVTLKSAAPAYSIDPSDPALGLVETAYERGFGYKPVRIRGGGTESAAIYLKDATGKPPLSITLSTPDEGYHKENEMFKYGERFTGGVLTFLHFFDQVADAS